jgi:hypothetical protein
VTPLITENTNSEDLLEETPKGRVLEEDKIKDLNVLLTPLFKANNNQTSLTLSKLLLKEDINYETALTIFGYQNGNIDTLKKTYHNLLEEKEKNDNISLFQILYTSKDKLGLNEINEIEREIKNIIQAPLYHNKIVGSLGTDTLVIADPKRKTVNYKTVVIKNDKDYSRQKKVIDAYPSEVIVYDSPIAEEPRKFEITWKSKIKKSVLKTGPDLLEDIKNDLIRDGYVTANRLVNDVLPALMNTYIRQELAEIKTDIETPGFFRNPSSNEIITVKYDISDPNNDDLKQALRTLEELAKWYTGNEVKLATVFKWGLIAPFIYSQKQVGSWTPWLYLYGKAKSGKTTLGQMVTYLWETPNQNNDITGSGFDTVARVGGKLAQSTFPIIVNEPAGAFQRVSVLEMLKGAIERTVSRGRYEGRRYTNKPSFNPVIFTANQFLPDDDAMIRRLWVIGFTHNEKKTETKEFEKQWQIKNHQKCRFNLLKPIAQAVAIEYLNDNSLWEMDWQELANTLLTRIYLDTGIEPPRWIYQWSKSETMEDMDDEHREDIRIFLLDKINREFKKVPLVDDEYKHTTLDTPDKVRKNKEFNSRVWHVINEGYIPWMIPYQTKKGKKYVCLTVGFKKELHQSLKICQPLQGIAQLMDWKHQTVRLPDPTLVIKISFNSFVEFIYRRGVNDEQSEL